MTPKTSTTRYASTFRATIYGAIIFFGISEMAASIMAAIFPTWYYDGSVDPKLVYGSLSAVFSLLTWIWASVLVSYHRRPDSTARLTTLRTHFYSVISASVVWLIFGILFSTQIPHQCHTDIYDDGMGSFWCGTDVAAAGLGYVLFALHGALAIRLGLDAKTVGNFDVNVAHRDHEGEPVELA